jgi:PEGA domain
MKHKKSLIALLFVVALTPLLFADEAPIPPRAVQVQIDSRPDMAEVWVDGKFIGSTHLTYRLTPGDHKLELVRPHYTTWSRTLTVADQPTRVAALMQETSDKPCQ